MISWHKGITDYKDGHRSRDISIGLAQDCSNSSALAMELLQSYKPSIWYFAYVFYPNEE